MKITEEWLKEQGWEISHYDIEFRVEIFHYATKMFGKDKVIFTDAHELKIFREYEEPCECYADVLIDNVDTTEKLMKALALCEVTTTPTNSWHKVAEELPPVDTEVVCKMKGVPHTEHFVCKWDGKYWWTWGYCGEAEQGWFGLNIGWEVVEWKEI